MQYRFMKSLITVLYTLILLFSLTTGFQGCTYNEKSTEILWDSYGIPHVYASSPEQMFYAFGWSQMQNHGDLVLKLYGQARGRASEYWGNSFETSDLWVHTNNIPELGRRWLEEQDPSFRTYLDSFISGMNAYAEEHPESISENYRSVLPVLPEDPLTHVIRVIHFHFVTNPVEGGFNPNSFDSMGSNAWAIGPQKSASGNAMLVVNPHLPWGDMFTWFEAHLMAPGINVYGVALVGGAFIGIGFNEDLGWTHTNNAHDGADLFELILKEDGYEWDGGVHSFQKREISYKIRQESGILTQKKFTIKESVHGPVINEQNGKAIALRVVGLDEPHLLKQYWDMARSRNLRDFEQAQKNLQNPMFTVMYADRKGHIMHLFGGRTPVRPEGSWDWNRAVPGNRSATLWTQTHPYDDLPKVIDPQSGWLQNANDPPWTTTFPRSLDRREYPSYMSKNFMHFRAQRSALMLARDDTITYDELVAYKFSTRMELADRLLDDLLPAVRKRDHPFLNRALEVLESWDRKSDTDSRGAVLFKEWCDEMGLSVSQDHLYKEPWSQDFPMRTPDGIADLETAVNNLEIAAHIVEDTYGRLDIPWGDVFRLKRDTLDLPSNGGPGDPYGIFRVTNYRPDKNNEYVAVGGDSYVAIIEFSDPIHAKALLTYGNASQPGSPHRTDQLELFSQKRLRSVWTKREDILDNLESRTVF